MRWFPRERRSPYATALAMIGAKPGQQVVVIGASHAALAAELALVTGLNGTTTIIDNAEMSDIVDTAAATAGALLDFRAAPPTMLPVENERIDLVVLTRLLRETTATDQRFAIQQEAFRVLRPGGRLIVVDGILRRGRFAWSPTPQASTPVTDTQRVMTDVGFRAVRLLAEAEGLTYVEGVKPRSA